MTEARKIPGTVEAWENEELGNDVKHAQKASKERAESIEKSLGLRAISIRLPESVIEEFKMLAGIEGMGYQPLMREALIRFADCEMKNLARAYAAQLHKDAEARKAA